MIYSYAEKQTELFMCCPKLRALRFNSLRRSFGDTNVQSIMIYLDVDNKFPFSICNLIKNGSFMKVDVYIPYCYTSEIL